MLHFILKKSQEDYKNKMIIGLVFNYLIITYHHQFLK